MTTICPEHPVRLVRPRLETGSGGRQTRPGESA